MNKSCLICGDSSDSAQEWISRYSIQVSGVEVCSKCAECVANAFYKNHSGKWLTWDNPKSKISKRRSISSFIKKQVFERDLYRCLHCETHLDLTCDHIHPLSQGGKDVIENLQTLCRSCNSKKGTGGKYA